MLKFKSKLIILLLIYVTTLIGCNKSSTTKSDPISRTELFMGTVVTITLYDSTDSSILDKAFDRVAEIESFCTSFKVLRTKLFVGNLFLAIFNVL